MNTATIPLTEPESKTPESTGAPAAWPTPSGGTFNTLICAPYSFAMGSIQKLMDMYNEFNNLMSKLAADLAKTLGGYFDADGKLQEGVIQLGMDDTITSGNYEADSIRDTAYAGFASMGVGIATGLAMAKSESTMNEEVKAPQAKLEDAQSFQKALQSKPNVDIEMREMGAENPASQIIDKWKNGDVSGFKNNVTEEENAAHKWYKPWQSKTTIAKTPVADAAGNEEAAEILKGKLVNGEPSSKSDFGKVKKAIDNEVKTQQGKIESAQSAHTARVQIYRLYNDVGTQASQSTGQIFQAADTAKKAAYDAAAAGEKAAQQSIADNQSQAQQKANEEHKEANELLQTITAMASQQRA